MKLLHLLSSTALLALCLPTSGLHAQTARPSDDPFVKKSGDTAPAAAAGNAAWTQPILILEAYALDLADAHRVLAAERGHAARYLRVLELEKAGKARLETLTALSAKSGMRAVSESVDEVRYPTEFDPGGVVEIRSDLTAGVLNLTVADEGPGIPADAAERIFRPFARLDSRVNEGATGTGLGLAIARDLAASMGGSLRLVPSLRGATFELRVPAPPVAAISAVA